MEEWKNQWMTNQRTQTSTSDEENSSKETENTEKEIPSISIEQVHVNMPQITVYYYLSGCDEVPAYTEVQAELNHQMLTVESSREFYGENAGIHYYVLVDANLSKGYLSEVREVLSDFPQEMNQGDTWSLYVMGDTLQKIINNKSKDAEVQDEIENITHKSSDLAFADALERLSADMQKQEKEDYAERTVILTITPVKEWSEDSITCHDVLEGLKKDGVSVYEMIAGVEQEDLFTIVADETGGSVNYYNQGELQNKLEDLCSHLNSCYMVRLRGSDNRVTNSYQNLALTYSKEDLTDRTEIWVSEYQPDNVSPEIVQGVIQDNNQIWLKFSEPVTGAEEANHYYIEDNKGKVFSISQAEYHYDEELKEGTAVLTLQEPLYRGNYCIVTEGIRDISMEENTLTNAYILDYEDGPGFGWKMWNSFMDYWWILVLILCVVSAVVFGLTKRQKVRNRKMANLVMNTKSMNQTKDKVSLADESNGGIIKLVVYRNGRNFSTVSRRIDGSLIVGRSDLSDIYFEDEQLSRQHFAIEYSQGNFYIEDLETTNGTMLNGSLLQKKEILNNNDKVSAGSLEFVVRW